jgi:multidrug efflux pump subunit AcrA (membrane-fusion protein)
VARSYRVRIGLSNPGQLQIGMTVDTNLIVDKRDNVMVLPTFAIDNNAVWLVIDNKLHKQAVVTGITSAERTEIVSGLAADSQIVTTLSADFREGQAVRIKTSQP